MSPLETTFIGDADLLPGASLLDFWRWAFSDLCDDDLKGIFAEWMVRVLLRLPADGARRISWANSDIILPSRARIEVKASALWQSWKLWNEDGRAKGAQPAVIDPQRIRFGDLQARTAVAAATPDSARSFKSDIYVFCMNTQTDPKLWDAWKLSDWEFYVMTKEQLSTLKIGKSISLATLRRVNPAMSARELQAHMNP
jgi:hypothetical protein